MRVISQDGTIDIPYELSAVTIGHKVDLSKFDINIRSKLLDERPCIVAIYSTEEKAKKAMEELRYAYICHSLVKMAKTLPDGIYEKLTMGLSGVFQFPAEEELE